LAASAVQRFAAFACIAGAYQAATTYFAQVWVLVTVVAAALMATAPPHWVLPEGDPPVLRWPSRAHLWQRLFPGWLLMAAAGGAKLAGLSPHVTLWTWLAGLLWLLIGARSTGAASSGTREGSSSVRAAWICGLLVVLFAAALRLWEIDTVPRRVHCDEGTTVMIGQQFFADPDRDWFGMREAGSYTTMSLCYVLAGVGVWIDGLNLVAARLPDVVLGILSVALLFDGLRRVSTLPVALVAALLLAANHTHIGFSRIASSYIQTAFVVSLVFGLFSRVWTTPSYLNVVLLGAAVALGVQTYRASLLVFPLICSCIGLLLLLRPSQWRARRVPLAFLAVTWATASAPFAVALWEQGDQMMERSRTINIFAEHKMEQLKREVYQTDSAVEVVLQQAWNSLLGFHRGYDHQPQYGSLYPMADRYTAALMIPGSVLALLAIRRFLAANALVFTAGYLLFGLGMQWAPGFNRATGALPLGMVLPALALVQSCSVLWRGRGWPLRGARHLCIAAGTVLCVYTSVHIYFVDYMFSRRMGDSSSEAGWAAREYPCPARRGCFSSSATSPCRGTRHRTRSRT
jgi:hypothetical protein